MKTLKQAKVGETVKVVKQTQNYGYGHHKGC